MCVGVGVGVCMVISSLVVWKGTKEAWGRGVFTIYLPFIYLSVFKSCLPILSCLYYTHLDHLNFPSRIIKLTLTLT